MAKKKKIINTYLLLIMTLLINCFNICINDGRMKKQFINSVNIFYVIFNCSF